MPKMRVEELPTEAKKGEDLFGLTWTAKDFVFVYRLDFDQFSRK